MKVLYSEIKQFIPKLKANAKQVSDALTLIGLMTDSLSEVKIAGKRDWLLDLEVRQNRPDYLGTIGIAREVATYFKVPFVLPTFESLRGSSLPAGRQGLRATRQSPRVTTGLLRSQSLPRNDVPIVKVLARRDVKRACVVRVEGVDGSAKSPLWLQDTLEALGMNPVSLLVDLSNLAMLTTGFPNHFFDADKVSGELTWTRPKFATKLTSLDGTTLNLSKNKELTISDNIGPLVLASAVGGQRSAVSMDTKNLLIEVAVYDPLKMRQDARGLGVQTEASIRLEKELSAEQALWSLEYTVELLRKFAGKKNIKVSQIFDYYPKHQRSVRKIVTFSPSLSSKTAGVEVTVKESEEYLGRLGFDVKKGGDKLKVVSPSWRSDIENEMDLVEEVLRMKGFDHIPSTPPAFSWVQDQTPAHLRLEERLRKVLEMHGFNEILSLPLSTSEDNIAAYSGTAAEVRLQNAVNEELPALRQTLLGSLAAQQQEYLLSGVSHPRIFEIGKVFGKRERYFEEEHLGLLVQSNSSDEGWTNLSDMRLVLENMLVQIGAKNIFYKVEAVRPDLALEAYKIFIDKFAIGSLFKIKPKKVGSLNIGGTAAAEIDISLLVVALEATKKGLRQARELIGKLIDLDANIEIPVAESQILEISSIRGKLQKLCAKIDQSRLWSIAIKDRFLAGPDSHQARYTVRMTYHNLSDTEAKLLHEKIFSSRSKSS